MLKVLRARIAQGHRTTTYPREEPSFPERFRGRPALDASKCPAGCRECVSVCPTDAIKADQSLELDMGRCLFCTACTDACPEEAIGFSKDYRLAVAARDSLLVSDNGASSSGAWAGKSAGLFRRSFAIRVVSAGGCNGCESEVNVLNSVVYDLGRFGVSYVASPRHADAMLITGPVTENMRQAVLATYEAIATPKLVIAVGACAISGGPFVDHAEVNNGAESVVPVDLFIPGCPPNPYTILDGILSLLDRRP